MHGVTPGITSMKNNDEFVDDTDGYADVEERNNKDEYEVVQKLQNKAQSWEKLIAVLGGAIAFHKCAWKMIGWNYNVFPPLIKMQ